ncbi:MAG: phage tail protein [Candidatus Cloacimonetes bacterium]|nr:phage tail protein [Candidatus Cloacimonadota bacterium]
MTFMSVITPYGRQAILSAISGGENIQIRYMGIGDGDGEEYNPSDTQTDLKNEWHEIEINNLYLDENNPNWLIVEGYIPETIGGYWIREFSLKDENRKIIAISSWPATYKPTLPEGSSMATVMRMVIEVSNTSVFELKIDTSLALVTRDEFLQHINQDGRDEVHHSSVNPEEGTIAVRHFNGRLKAGKPVEIDEVARLQEMNDLIAMIGQLSDTGVPLWKTYVGDGVTNRFEMLGLLSDNPSAVLVYLDGIKQVGELDYSIVNSIYIEFVSPPAQDVKIEFLTLVTLTQYPMASTNMAGVVKLSNREELQNGSFTEPNKVVTAENISGSAGFKVGHNNWQINVSQQAKLNLYKTNIRDGVNGDLFGLNGNYTSAMLIPNAITGESLKCRLTGMNRVYRFYGPVLEFDTIPTIALPDFRIGDIYYFIYAGQTTADVRFLNDFAGMSFVVTVAASQTLALMYLGVTSTSMPIFSRVV